MISDYFRKRSRNDDTLGIREARDSSTELLDIIGQVRRRWRVKQAIRGAVGVAAIGAAVFLLTAWGLETWRFTAGAILAARIVIALSVAGLVAYLLVRPLLRRVTDQQVALYLEEHEPSLQVAIVSAVEADRAGSGQHSRALVRKLVESAVEKVRAIDGGRDIERPSVIRYGAIFAAVVAGISALLLLGPAYLRHAVSALFLVSRSVEAAVPYRIDVTPGNATVPRGIDQTITAQLSGFDTDQASLMVRKAADAPFERFPLVRAEGAKYEGLIFDIEGPLDYFIEALGVRSPVFTLKVVDLPYVERLELEFHFPAYTGLEPRKVEEGGDIAVLRGTEVRVRVLPTMATGGGQIVMSEGAAVPLAAAADGALTSRFRAEKDGFYRVELDGPAGERVTASPQYTIDVLADQPPTVSIARPGRDTKASPIEEVFVEARADDDYGVRDMELVYSVNGGAEKSIKLFDGKNRLAEVTAGHTFYLEELGLEPGDFVSYYARAADNDAVAGAKRATSDIYFLQIRPLRQEFRRAQSQAQGGGGGGPQVGALSEQQRKIIAATFNVNRDRKTMTADKLREHTVVIALSQARLREQVDGLVTRMNSRLVEQDPAFKKIADLLPQASAEMRAAEEKLRAAAPDQALAPEQRALQFLQKAEEEYELQVSMGGQQGGGGGAGSIAEDLADLFELELDKMANQYETAQRATQQNADQQIDELAEKLKELARRQEQEAERQRQRAAAGQQSAAGGGTQQRALAEQVEEAARRLEQLSREQNRSDLMESARRLHEAADAMRRASATGDPSAAAQASAALERLREAERRLQQAQGGRAERDVRDALRQAEEIAREHSSIAEEVNSLTSAGEGRQQKVTELTDRKNALESRVGSLEKQLDKTAGEINRQERDASRKLTEAANGIRDSRVRDAMRYSRSMLRDSGVSSADRRQVEDKIGADLDALRDRLSEAASALGRTRTDPMTDALERARQLARGAESMDQRLRERTTRGAQQGQRGQSGREGQQPGDQQGQQSADRGQEGQRGQRGQPGQEGQQGQQGQQGQEGQRGQEGQQGQQGQQGGGQGGEQGQQQQGGRDGRTDGRGGIGDTTGDWRAGGGWGDRRPGRLSNDEVRQFRGEARQWTAEAEQLRGILRGQRIPVNELDEALRKLRELQDDRVYHDVEELQRLQAAVAEGLKRFEYALRRKVEGANNQVFIAGSEDVPEEFRKLVEQYYKSLAKEKR